MNQILHSGCSPGPLYTVCPGIVSRHAAQWVCHRMHTLHHALTLIIL